MLNLGSKGQGLGPQGPLMCGLARTLLDHALFWLERIDYFKKK